ncbi:MAG TPA: right-handed parallel beta-helix repeat-containing protein [Caulobacteraceae bacterium]
MKRFLMFIALLGAGAFVLAAQPAAAQATRTWVSGVGDDANPCSRTAPCKTFAGAISKTAAAGEINCLDPGGFGALTITKSIAVICDSGEGGVLVSGSNGIVINAATTDNVYLSGLDFEGVGTGLSGVLVLRANNVTVRNSIIRGFITAGIYDNRSSTGTLTVDGDSVADNPNAFGIYVKPQSVIVNAVITNTQVNGDKVGLRVEDGGKASMRNSTASNNLNNGVLAFSTSTAAEINLDSDVVSGNGVNGVVTTGANALIRISHNVINNSGIGISTPSGTITSFSPATNVNTSGGTANGAAVPQQ